MIGAKLLGSCGIQGLCRKKDINSNVVVKYLCGISEEGKMKAK